MKTQKLQPVLILAIVALVLSACGPSAEELVGTYVAETAAAATSTPTITPTLAPTPTVTPTPTLTPTPTPLPPLLVPEEYSTIQGAIDAAEEGDVIIVSPGTYTENIDFIGKDITVRSSDPEDPKVVDATIIDGGGKGSVVIFQSGETAEARLAGFTITNGDGSRVVMQDGLKGASGGGVLVVSGSSPTIVGNKITGNQAEQIGGGIFAGDQSSPTIEGNEITGNQAQWGGGIMVRHNSSPTIVGNEITDNVALKDGGGIYVWANSSPTIEGNEITDNVAFKVGGGIHVGGNSSPTIVGNMISNNQAKYGGGIDVYASSPTIEGNTITENVAKENGGGIHVGNSSLTIEGNTISGNIAQDYGGGVWAFHESLVIFKGNTIFDNKARFGKDIDVESSSTLMLNDPDDNVYENNQPVTGIPLEEEYINYFVEKGFEVYEVPGQYLFPVGRGWLVVAVIEEGPMFGHTGPPDLTDEERTIVFDHFQEAATFLDPNGGWVTVQGAIDAMSQGMSEGYAHTPDGQQVFFRSVFSNDTATVVFTFLNDSIEHED